MQKPNDYLNNIFSKKEEILQAYDKSAKIKGWEYVEKMLKKRLGTKFYGHLREQIKSHSPSQSQALKEIGDDPNGSYFIHGNYSSGKTHIAALLYEILCYWRLARGYVWISEVELKEDLRKASTDREYLPFVSVGKILSGRIKALFIDDMGKTKPSPFYREKLFGIVDTLYRHEKQLVITSNYPLSQLAIPDQFGVGICNRIKNTCRVLPKMSVTESANSI